ncbi:MAG: DUF4783 domain-containing protein [Crocinitomicaceae bacterium]
MKYLIGLFFVFVVGGVFSQDAEREIIASNETYPVSKEKHVDTTEIKSVAKSIAMENIEMANPKAYDIAASIKTDILSGFNSGKAALLAKYFPSNIDVNILGKSNLYSKSQAQQVLSTFFTQNKPSGFTVVHEGQSNGTKYFIGTYNSGASKYRVTVNVKSGGAEQISSISIER